MAALTYTADPAAPTALVDAVVIALTGLTSNDAASYSASTYPTEPEIVYHLHAVAPAGSTPALDLKSESFSVDADGTKTLLPWIFPVDGTWTLNLILESDDSTPYTGTLVIA